MKLTDLVGLAKEYADLCESEKYAVDALLDARAQIVVAKGQIVDTSEQILETGGRIDDMHMESLIGAYDWLQDVAATVGMAEQATDDELVEEAEQASADAWDVVRRKSAKLHDERGGAR